MGTVRDLAERLWTGVDSTETLNPLTTFAGLEELSDGVAFVSSFANVSAFDTTDGLVLVDTGGFMAAGGVYTSLRGWTDKPLHTAVYTHGHVDHVFGVRRFDEEAVDRGWSRPVVLAHEALPPRFDRYKLTAGYNAAINARQFRIPNLSWPTDYRYPDRTYRDHLEVEVGGVRFELHHDRGETDDHTWVYVPAHRVLCAGDLFIWASPNCGNPQKVQRYPKEWAHALDKMRALDAEILLPGHGPPILGADRVALALSETAELLHTVHDRTLALMNQGKSLDAVMHEIELPRHLLERPYLRPVYDDPAFIVRNIWRLYGGWYDGNPARLKPASDHAIAREVLALAGGVDAVIARARELAELGDPAACQLAEWAWQAAPEDAQVREVRALVYDRRASAETSLMARSIYAAAVAEARARRE
ncbi:MAG TPA: alkyl sulfatase dimerization domain-containing protein [Kofleriaceae bacterium]|nr:alkyl sulfatase dimerization domain-containing protein [Kofleriaceae bacterium]